MLRKRCVWYMMLIQNLNNNNIFNIRNKNKSKTKTTQFSYLPRHYSPRIIQQISVTCPARLLKLSLSPEPDSDSARRMLRSEKENCELRKTTVVNVVQHIHIFTLWVCLRFSSDITRASKHARE